MDNSIFYRFGKLIYLGRWFIIILWLIVLLACIPCIPKLMDPFKAIGFVDPNSQSAKANDVLNKKLGYSYNRFIIIYSNNKWHANSKEFNDEVKSSLADLHKLPFEHHIIYPENNQQQISKDKHTAYAIILFKGNQEADHTLLQELKNTIKQPLHLQMKLGGEPIFLDDTKRQTQIDLYRSEYVATPIAIITMLIVFESVVAASLPVILGGACAMMILTALFLLGHLFSLSVFTINIALLLGLCLSLDYALLIINRYRDELQSGRSVLEAIAYTQATAGKAVFFSGMAVFISLSALLLFPINILFSVGVGGLAAVSVSVAVAIVVLPAVLGILNHHINSLPIRIFKIRDPNSASLWRRLINVVVKRPGLFFVLTLIILLTLGYPCLNIKIGISDFRILPTTQPSRVVFDTFRDKFGESKLAPILVILEAKNKTILNAADIAHIYNYSNEISRDPRVESITSIVNTEPRLSKKEYQTLYMHPDYLPPELKKLLTITTHDDMTVLTVTSKYESNSPPTTALINHLRDMRPDRQLTMQVTGTSVNTIDVLKTIEHIFPLAFLWIVGFTYLVLLILLRSLLLPLKAIITTMLSLCSSYGILVLVIQEGYLHKLLNFEPQGILDISLLIIIFCALFGISMDYEVFLLTRIKEYYEQSKDNVESIVSGIDRSCKIISSAAIIVILICFSFMRADILIVKAFGMGIAIAVFVDAFIIRLVLVPATMVLLGKWNWYLPRWIGKVIPKVSLAPDNTSDPKNKH